MERLIVTGATGFVGSNLARRLVLEGCEVNAIVRPSSRLDLVNDIKDRIKIYVFDGSIKNLTEIFDAANPTVILHLASLFIAEHKSEDIASLIQSNILFGSQVLEAASKCGLKYFINTGTHWQHYNGDNYNPVNLYAATKKAFEAVAKYYLEATPLRMVTVKLCDTYGPNDPRPKVASLFNRISRTGEVLDMSSGEQELGLVYIDDVVQGFLLALKYVKDMKEHEHQFYMIAPHKIYTLKEAATIFARVSGRPLHINWGTRPYRQREMMKVWKYGSNLLEDLDVVSLPDGVCRMLESQGNL